MTLTLFVTKQYMGQLRAATDPSRKQSLRKNAEARLGKLYDSPMVELCKLENEIARNARLSPIERFMIGKRMRALNGMKNEAVIGDAMASCNEALAIGGAHKQFN